MLCARTWTAVFKGRQNDPPITAVRFSALRKRILTVHGSLRALRAPAFFDCRKKCRRCAGHMLCARTWTAVFKGRQNDPPIAAVRLSALRKRILTLHGSLRALRAPAFFDYRKKRRRCAGHMLCARTWTAVFKGRQNDPPITAVRLSPLRKRIFRFAPPRRGAGFTGTAALNSLPGASSASEGIAINA